MKLPQYQPQFNYQPPNLPGPRLQGVSVQTNAAMFGGQQGQDLQRLGSQLQQTASRAAYLYDDYNSTKAQEAGNAFQREFLAWQSSAAQRKGKDAENLAADYAKWSQERLAALGKGLNPVQRGRFQEMIALSGAAQQRWATDYGAEQKRFYQLETHETTIQTAADYMAANIGDPEMTASSIETIRQAEFERCKMLGLDEKTSIAKMDRSVDGALANSVEMLIRADDTGTASAVMGQFASDLSGKSRLQLTASLNQKREQLRAKAEAQRTRALLEAERAEKLRVETESTAKARGILDSVSGYATLEEKKAKAFEAADNEKDFPVREILWGRIERELERMDKREKADVSLQSMEFREQADAQNLTPLQAISKANTNSSLSPGARDDIIKSYEEKAKKTTESNMRDYNMLSDKVDRGGVTDEDIYAARTARGLTDQQTKALLEQRRTSGTIDAITWSKVDSIYKKMTKESEMPLDMYPIVLKEARRIVPLGTAVDDEKLSEIISNIALESGESKGGFGFGYGVDEKYYDAESNNREANWLPFVDDDEMGEIDATLRRLNVLVNDFNRRLYKKSYILDMPDTRKAEK